MLSKKDLKCIGEFLPSKYPKPELNYACVGRGGIFATDSRKAIKFHFSELQFPDFLLHKKLLKGFESTVGKDDIVRIEDDGKPYLVCGSTKMFVDTANFEYVYPDAVRILDVQYPHHFVLSSLGDILFELTQKNCFIDAENIFPLIAHSSGGELYDIFYKTQGENDMGMVKIISSKVVDDEMKVIYTASIMGRKFESQAKD